MGKENNGTNGEIGLQRIELVDAFKYLGVL